MGMIHYVRRGSKLRILAGDCPKWISNSRRAAYIRAVCLSAPLWVKLADFRSLHAEAVWKTEMNQELHVLDHIIPLTHPRVCGLTVPWNLRVIPWRPNCSKGNYWCPEQEDLFPTTIEEYHAQSIHHRADRPVPGQPRSSQGAALGHEHAC